jgi:hypothetical protein
LDLREIGLNALWRLKDLGYGGIRVKQRDELPLSGRKNPSQKEFHTIVSASIFIH